MFNFGFKRKNSGLPKPYLFYSRLPNSENLPWVEGDTWDETALWSGWELPVEVYAAVGTGFWFSDATTPIPHTGAEILAWSGINQYHVLFSTAKGLVVYDPYTVTDATIRKADRYMKQPLYYGTPTTYFNGTDITGSTSFDSGVLGTNPGQWVLDNTGVLVNAGVDAPAMEGMRLEWEPSGVELITNISDRELSSDTGFWIKGAGWVFNVDRMSHTGSAGSLVKTSLTTVGKTYSIGFSIKDYVSGNAGLAGIMYPGGYYPNANGNYTKTFIAVATTLTFFFDGTASIDNISVKELLPVWYDTHPNGDPIIHSVSQPTRTFDTVLDGSKLGPELIPTASGDGTSTTGWLVTNGTVNSVAGELEFTNTNATNHNLRYEFTSVPGKRYALSWFSRLGSMTGLKYLVRNNTGSSDILTNTQYTPGNNTIYFTAPVGAISISVYLSSYFGGLGTAYFDNISVKEVFPALTQVSNPSTTFKKYARNDPLVMPGYLSEPARTNKCTCRKANPIDTTGISKTGDAAAILSVVDDTAALTAAGLSGICTSGKVYKLDNSAGVGPAYALLPGVTANNTIAHSLSLYLRTNGLQASVRWDGVSTGEVVSTGTAYTRLAKENSIPGTTTNKLTVRASAGTIVYFVLPQLEEGAFCTSPIAKLQDGTDPLTALTRAGTVLSYPTLGKISSNNMAFRMTVVPRAGGQTGRFLQIDLGTDTFFIAARATFLQTYHFYDGASKALPDLIYTLVKDKAIELIFIQSSLIGTVFTCRELPTTNWLTPVVKNTSISKQGMRIGTSFVVGSSGNQFTGNISELDTLFIPEGITDPLAWAKKEWGIE